MTGVSARHCLAIRHAGEEIMAEFYAFVATEDLDPGEDQVTLLKTAATLGDLLAEASYNPDATTPWPRSQVEPTDHAGQILNEKADHAVAVTACLAREG